MLLCSTVLYVMLMMILLFSSFMTAISFMKGVCNQWLLCLMWLFCPSAVALCGFDKKLQLCFSACMFWMCPCSNTPDSNEWLIIRLQQSLIRSWSFESRTHLPRQEAPRNRMGKYYYTIIHSLTLKMHSHMRYYLYSQVVILLMN